MSQTTCLCKYYKNMVSITHRRSLNTPWWCHCPPPPLRNDTLAKFRQLPSLLHVDLGADLKAETLPHMGLLWKYWHSYRWSQLEGGFLHSPALLLSCTKIWGPYLPQGCHTGGGRRIKKLQAHWQEETTHTKICFMYKWYFTVCVFWGQNQHVQLWEPNLTMQSPPKKSGRISLSM